MTTLSNRPARLLVAAGTMLALASAALAGVGDNPSVIHVSGATLLENYLRARASTVDYIDADNNGVARGYPVSTNQQLAPFGLPSVGAEEVWPSNMKWVLLYEAVGSTNGFQELINFGRTYVTIPGNGATDWVEPAAGSGLPAPSNLPVRTRTASYFNRYRYIVAGAANPDQTGGNPEVPAGFGQIVNFQNPMGSPIRSTTDGTFRARFTAPGVASPGGLTVDLAVLDVPTTWAVTQSGSADFEKNPLEPGYGNNARLAVAKDGAATTRNNRLATLTGGANLAGAAGVFNPAANANSIFDNELVIAPVAPVVNFGVGRSQIEMTELRHLYTTGRLPSGENLVAVTRDSGSGTRNAFDNSIGVDPSFNIGENVGVANNGPQFDRLGRDFLPSNKQGNNRVEPSVINHRLAIGYVGPERGVEQAWLTNGQMEILGVRNNLPNYGGTQFVRPTISNILDNGPNGWVIFGPGVLASFGDPTSAPANKGGKGWMELFNDSNGNATYDLGEAFTDFNGNGVRDAAEPRPADLNPAMRNVEAAAFVNNITRSIRAFTDLPGSDQTVFTPGEFGATQFVLLGAIDNIKSADPTVHIPNPAFNATLQEFIRTQAGNVLSNQAYAAFGNSVQPMNAGNSRAGKVPTRTTVAQADLLDNNIVDGSFVNTYSDAALSPAAAFYVIDDATLVAPNEVSAGRLTYGNNLPLRNLIAGDFNADGLRNVSDIPAMIAAFRERNGGPDWTPPVATGALASLAVQTGGDVSPGLTSIEILGDFNGDGSFNAQDVRYFADGLALVATGPGAGALDRKAGFIAVDTAFGGNFFGTTLKTGAAHTPGAARADVANANGRLTPGFAPIGADGFPGNLPAGLRNIVDEHDINHVYAQFRRNPRVTDGALNWSSNVEAIGGDLSADINGDLVVDQSDIAEILTVLGTSMGDVNLDGQVNDADRAIVTASIATPPAVIGWQTGDLNGDGVINAADLALIPTQSCNVADIVSIGGFPPADGELTVDDYTSFINAFAGDDLLADIVSIGGFPPADGELTVDDYTSFINAFAEGCE